MNINLPEKRYYSIGEVSKAFNVNQFLLGFWEKNLIVKTKKNLLELENLQKKISKFSKLIYHLLKEKGLTIFWS